MTLDSTAYNYAKKIFKDKKFATSRLFTLFRRVQTRIEKVTMFLGENDIEDVDLKFKISLLSSLLDVKRKLRAELKELSQDFGKGKDSLGEILSTSTPSKK
ncbi:MAG: hypothetical protein E3J56_00625 [Candidatus Aminicenantes bacterium]|nr:MAG: hypothetical protein E3J56_00625 [Candidatus Aminicenantes bacterium]